MGLLGGVRILIVEDDEDNRIVLEESLRFQGAGVEAVGTAAEAAGILDRFDIILSDYDLPDHDAVWLLDHATRLLPPIPVILVSGYAECQVDAIANAPFACKLLKPVDVLDVGLEVIKALHQHRDVQTRTREIGGSSAMSPWTLFFDLGIAERAGNDRIAAVELLAASAEAHFAATEMRAVSAATRMESATLQSRARELVTRSRHLAHARALTSEVCCSVSHAARCTARHAVGSHAEPATTECAIPTG